MYRQKNLKYVVSILKQFQFINFTLNDLIRDVHSYYKMSISTLFFTSSVRGKGI